MKPTPSRTCRCAANEAFRHARERTTYSKQLSECQTVRHNRVEMAMRIQAMEAQTGTLIWRVMQGESCVVEIALPKACCGAAHEWIAAEAAQVFGGASVLRGHKMERIFHESKILAIGGGSSEVMKDFASRQLGW